MTCAACAARVKNWNGDDPKCAFPDGSPFDPDNWNCATMGQLRAKLEDHLFQPGTGKVAHQASEGDQHMVMVNTSEIEELESLTLWVSWYKQRGRTETLWLLNEYDPPRLPTEAEMLRILSEAL